MRTHLSLPNSDEKWGHMNGSPRGQSDVRGRDATGFPWPISIVRGGGSLQKSTHFYVGGGVIGEFQAFIRKK